MQTMRRLVAEMVPDEVEIIAGYYADGSDGFFWKKESSGEPARASIIATVSDREWLAVCALAEARLTRDQRFTYTIKLTIATGANTKHSQGFTFHILHATAEHRIEALCRVKHPELFQP